MVLSKLWQQEKNLEELCKFAIRIFIPHNYDNKFHTESSLLVAVKMAEAFKAEGNKLFAEKKFDEAMLGYFLLCSTDVKLTVCQRKIYESY